MVKHNAAHNEEILTLPITFGGLMPSLFKFESDAENPDFIWTKRRWVGPVPFEDFKNIQRWVNPFRVRDRMSKVRDKDELLAFLNSLGVCWSLETVPHEEAPVKTRRGLKWVNERPAQPILVSDVLTFQEFIRQALAMPFSEWQRLPGDRYLHADAIEGLETLCQERRRMLTLKFVPTTLRQAILGTLIAEKLAGNKYRQCELLGCKELIKVGGRKPAKRFCSGRHRLIAAMRRYRQKKSREENKG